MGSSFSSNKAVVHGKRLERARLLEEASSSGKSRDREKYLQATGVCRSLALKLAYHQYLQPATLYLVSRLANGQLRRSSRAYIVRAVEAQAATNCLTESTGCTG